ncbi:glycosyltransferase family 2 protein [Ectothiorhodospira mobilis]|uniref:glycosyltransferase family 2 protein n=1 Tax=Ectothiorhodospira mobilis TaxID=195064 RepID=UPI001EE929EF|nr:glycosyltransferase family 2 protein [Ectothiorhodospira mobilis]MCG5536456.1 glycosyltransferase [Ectothiorhodospira mobilis]
MSEPLVSVVMAVHNNERYLEAALNSILEQSWQNLELIVIDDASTDRSASILRDYACFDSRIRLLVNDQNHGLTWSLNRGLDEVQGELVARMDGDDIALPERLAKQVEAFRLNPKLVLCGTATINIDEKGKKHTFGEWPSNPKVLRWYSIFRPAVAHPSAMFRVRFGNQIIRYNENLSTAQDYDLWSRLLQHGDGLVLNNPLLLYRHHASSISSTLRIEQTESAANICQENLYREFPNFFIRKNIGYAKSVAHLIHNSMACLPQDATAALTTLLALESEYLTTIDQYNEESRRAIQRLTTRWVAQTLLGKGPLNASERIRVIIKLRCRLEALLNESFHFGMRRLRARL